jgi:hypothetical protein
MIERWSLAAGHVPGALEILLLAAALGLAAYEAHATFVRPRVRMPRAISMSIFGLRVLALLALLAVAFELGVRIESVSPAGRRLAVLIDTSASMALADAETLEDTPTRRLDRARQVWADSEAALTAYREEGLLLDIRAFDEGSREGAGDPPTALSEEPLGQASNLALALGELQQTGGIETRPVAGVVVMSDGLVADDEAEHAHLLAVAQALGAPVTTVSVGAPAIRDVSVADVRAGEFAFVENVAEFEASIVAHGLVQTSTHVELLRDGHVVARQPVTLAADGIPISVRFEVAPDRVGQFVYEIAVPVEDAETTSANNRRAFVIKVLRDKVRVLHVAGRPDWDVRAVRTLLRRDPNVELLSYYILRGADDAQREDYTAALSLIEFPTDELFREELGSFDLVILHNFDAPEHRVGRYMGHIARYVRDGGALILIGGDMGLADASYAAPELAALLPVDTRRPAPLEHAAFRPRLTEAGRRHPITAWMSARGSEGRDWAELPPLQNYNACRMADHAAAIGGSVLLEHPEATDRKGVPRPILAVAEPDQGRTMVLATGSTWRLGFAPDLPIIDGARPYDLLWLGAVRWLLRDETSGRLSLETDKPGYQVGEPVQLRAGALTTGYAPEPGVEISWQIERLEEGKEDAGKVAGGDWVTDDLGRASATLDALPIGAYAALARRVLAEEEIGGHEARRVFLVEPPGRELAEVDAEPGTQRLAEVAKITDGLALSAVDDDRLPADIPLADPFARRGQEVRIDSRREIPLAHGWLALVLLLLAFPGEWLLRRHHGQP